MVLDVCNNSECRFVYHDTFLMNWVARHVREWLSVGYHADLVLAEAVVSLIPTCYKCHHHFLRERATLMLISILTELQTFQPRVKTALKKLPRSLGAHIWNRPRHCSFFKSVKLQLWSAKFVSCVNFVGCVCSVGRQHDRVYRACHHGLIITSCSEHTLTPIMMYLLFALVAVAAAENCQTMCNFNYEPVCGSDGKCALSVCLSVCLCLSRSLSLSLSLSPLSLLSVYVCVCVYVCLSLYVCLSVSLPLALCVPHSPLF